MLTAFEHIKQSLSDAQQKTILHILSCNNKNFDSAPDSKKHSDNSLGIAEAIESSQSNVHAGIQKLIALGFLKPEQGKGTEKIYRLSSKGLASAFLLDCDYHDFMEYCKEHYQEAYWSIVRLAKKMDSLAARKFYLTKYFQYLYEHDMLQDGRTLSESETKRIMAWIGFEAQMALGDAESLRDMTTRYGITKEFLRECLGELEKKVKRAKAELDGK